MYVISTLTGPGVEGGQRDVDTDPIGEDKDQKREEDRNGGDKVDVTTREDMERQLDQLKEKIRVLERNNNGGVENHNTTDSKIKNYNCTVCRVSTKLYIDIIISDIFDGRLLFICIYNPRQIWNRFLK